jgi:adenine phosphoribosyltransferase
MTTTNPVFEEATLDLLRKRIQEVPEYPIPGVLFRDITPLLGDPVAFGALTDIFASLCDRYEATTVVGIEARGFILGAAAAARAGVGFVPARKAGKLPGAVRSRTYQLAYGTDTVELKEDALCTSDRVLVIDDVLASGGSAEAVLDLVRPSGATVVGLAVLIELRFLKGRERLAPALGGAPLTTLLPM